MPPRQALPAILVAGLLLMPAAAGAAERVSLPGLDGGQLTSADLEGGNVILVVWASWSPRCRDVVPRINALVRTWSPKARVATVVFQEDAAAVRQFLAGKNLSAPVYLDSSGSFSKKHAITTLPGLLIFKSGQADFRGKLPVNPDPVIERTLG